MKKCQVPWEGGFFLTHTVVNLFHIYEGYGGENYSGQVWLFVG